MSAGFVKVVTSYLQRRSRVRRNAAKPTILSTTLISITEEERRRGVSNLSLPRDSPLYSFSSSSSDDDVSRLLIPAFDSSSHSDLRSSPESSRSAV
ncbi:hypothetical protein R3P38DRAFT_3176387 [Favolaschia claudopus]|uniref:Uncharacterized protein n=1 Tax=Favolaschia claudopus TaxID=2862362 RepID=A0AAW0D6C7_9AGAR